MMRANHGWAGWAAVAAAAMAIVAAAARAEGPPADRPAWQPLLADDDLAGWKAVSFGGEGDVSITGGVLTLGMGEPMTAIVYTNEIRRMDYEIALEARRMVGNDFPCGLTFPVGDSHLTLVLGGWGGGLVGLSSIDGLDASENETGRYHPLERERWYDVRVAVSPTHVRVFLDQEPIIRLATEHRSLGLRPGSIERCTPLGIASYVTQGQVRNLRWRPLPPDPPAATP